MKGKKLSHHTPKKYSYNAVKELLRENISVIGAEMKKAFREENGLSDKRPVNVSSILEVLEFDGFLLCQESEDRYSLFKEMRGEK